MYSIVWKYTVDKENQEAFEFEYGKQGAWAKLFIKSKNYLGSFLHKNSEKNDEYLIIDTWTEKELYENFKKINKEKYEDMSSKFENFYNKEEKIGEFNSVK